MKKYNAKVELNIIANDEDEALKLFTDKIVSGLFGEDDIEVEEEIVDKLGEICVECGHSVKLGLGKFVNRIPVLDDYETKKENGRPFPDGEWICEECDNERADNG